MKTQFGIAAASLTALIATGVAHAQQSSAADDGEIVVTGKALELTSKVTGQTMTTVTAEEFANTPAVTIADIVKLSPGVTFIQGNGPRDVSISIRGSNARQFFGARNILIYEDDFPLTQPDGTARFDLTDPHAYGAIDVVRGPSSARYGNYAIGGAINFRTRPGGSINGVEAGFDVGSYGYTNAYAMLGLKGERGELMVFGSNVEARQKTRNNKFDTKTVDILGTYELSDSDRVAFKFIFNELDTDLSLRLSFNQYAQNPFQIGCETFLTSAPGCGSVSLIDNGFNGNRTNYSAEQASLGRKDRRTIAGARWEHDFGPEVTWRTQFTFDSRVIDQPTSPITATGSFPSYNATTDFTIRTPILGMESLLFIGGRYSYLDNGSISYNNIIGGNRRGGLAQTTIGNVKNYGINIREELSLTDTLQLVVGLGLERSVYQLTQTVYNYPIGANPTTTLIPANRTFKNTAPEASLYFTPDKRFKFHARVGTGYGTPATNTLFITPAGVFGNNTQLEPQKATGVDVGVEIMLGDTLSAEVTGFYEWFRNEFVSQSPGANLNPFTFNVPRSEHRGVEVGIDWAPFGRRGGLRFTGTYSYNNQVFKRYVERLSAGAVSATFDRAGNRIPGVIPHALGGRLRYDQPDGPLEGLGGYVSFDYRARYQVDNANLIQIPGVKLVGLNIHYDPPKDSGFLSRLSFWASVENLFDETYIGSSAIISDTPTATNASLRNSTGAIYAGAPRSFFGGVKVRF